VVRAQAGPDDVAMIRSVVEAWAMWRDAGAWTELRSTWASGGRMHTTWFRGAADDFVDAARRGFERGDLVHHFLGGTVVEVAGGRAIAQTKATISQRLVLHDVEVDVTCTGRFYDFFEHEDGAWRIALREPIYEKDRIDPVVPGEVPRMDRSLLESLPAGCRHLLYCQIASGMHVHTDTLGLRGDEIARLHLDAQSWLSGRDLSR
jgi:hypothetical protein